MQLTSGDSGEEQISRSVIATVERGEYTRVSVGGFEGRGGGIGGEQGAQFL
jgi:hypothetical protein